MTRPRVRGLLGLAFGAAIIVATLLKPKAAQPSEWPGVDDAVIGRFVREAGHPPPQPLIEWMRGDLLLFAFLCAGLFAGFMLGFFGRALFVERRDSSARASGPDRG
jgi:cobalt/nickel transport protein